MSKRTYLESNSISVKQVKKCPFAKWTVKKHGEVREFFQDCIGSLCMAFSYEKIGDIETTGCKRMGKK